MRTSNIESRTSQAPVSSERMGRLGTGAHLVLVVEDEESIAAGLTDCLEAEGFAVEWCPSGVGIEERILSNPPVLLIMDIQLGDANGREIYHAVREAGSGIPIILMSGSDPLTTHDLDDASAFLTKPFAVEDLLRTAAALNVFPTTIS